jgi:signal transduction histidine kinase
MKISLTGKLTLAFLLVALTATFLVALVIRLYSPEQLNRLVIEQQRIELSELLEEYYLVNGSLQGFAGILQRGPRGNGANPAGWDESRSPSNRRQDTGFFRPDRKGNLFGITNPRGLVIVPLPPQFPPGTRVSRKVLSQAEPVEVDGQLVAYILTAPNPPDFTPAERAFLGRTYTALWIAAVGAALLALVVGLILARTLTRPLHALIRAAQNMASGDLEQQVEVKSEDEIGQLSQVFNHMSSEIARVNRQRRQMTADIAHDLRTPLTVIAGYVESMRDGVLPPTPERLDVIHNEINQLQRLVNDLRTLSRADAGELALNVTPILPLRLLENAAAPYYHQADIHRIGLKVEAVDNLPPVELDESRMAQVFSNLISNALRFVPEGGRIKLTAALDENEVVFSVIDDGPGIPPGDLAHIFDRFYRGDASRTGEDGESGLGLAITKALVEAQGGSISVDSELGTGTVFYIHFPAKRTPGKYAGKVKINPDFDDPIPGFEE